MRHAGTLRWLAAAALLLAGASACRREAAAPADRRTAVWLDISPAIGDPPRDPGDALALLQAFGSGTLRVRGVSVTFGNVPLVRGYPAAQELMERLDTGLLRPWRGASSPEERAAPTEATALLEEALAAERLTIVAVGPVTTLASVLLRQPAIASRIERIVIVAGRPTSSAPDDPSDPVDPNVMADPASVQVVLDSAAPIALVPASIEAHVGLDATDLDRLDEGRGPIKLITPSSRAWLQNVSSRTGGAMFPVPAMLAVDVAAHPGDLRCEAAVAALRSAATGRPALMVSSTPGTPGRTVMWCRSTDPGAKDRMIADVRRVQPLR